MRTKTLLLTAALGVASVATSMAQAVYSVNVVGYVTVTVRPGFNMIANPLVVPAGGNTLANLIPATSGAADGTSFYKFVPGVGYRVNVLDISGVGDWDPNPNETVDFGSGGFLLNPAATPYNVTFVGEVAQGPASAPLTTAIPAGFSFVSSKVPQSGGISSVLNLQPNDGDVVYQYRNDGVNPLGYQIFVNDISGVGGWDPAEPVLQPGHSVLLNAAAPVTWTRVFTVAP